MITSLISLEKLALLPRRIPQREAPALLQMREHGAHALVVEIGPLDLPWGKWHNLAHLQNTSIVYPLSEFRNSANEVDVPKFPGDIFNEISPHRIVIIVNPRSRRLLSSVDPSLGKRLALYILDVYT